LQVIYNRLEPSQASYSNLPLESSAEVSNNVPTLKKKRSVHPCARLCVCMWGLFVISTLVLTMLGSIHWYYSVKGCTNSPHFEMEELITDIETVKQINFDLVTAGVVFDTHEGDELIVKFYHSAREAYLLDEMEGGMAVIDNVLYIKDNTPAFEFSTCQYTYVEVLFPADVKIQSDADPISITGSVKVGYVGSYYLSNIGDLDIKVNVGIIDMEAVNANSVAVSAGLGAIFAENIWSEVFAKFVVNTGSVNSHSIMTPQFSAKTNYGTSWNTDIQADKATVHAEYGYSTLLRPTHFSASTNQEIEVTAHYGKALASYDQFYNVQFNLKSGQGHVDIMFDDACEIGDTTESSLLGMCTFDAMEPVTTVTVQVCHGNGHFIQTEPDFDELESSVDFPEYQIDDVEEDSVNQRS